VRSTALAHACFHRAKHEHDLGARDAWTSSEARATRQRLLAQLRTVGFVAAEDSSVAIATARFAGWVEEVRVSQGQLVERGQVLAIVSGPEILTAQQVYLAGLEAGLRGVFVPHEHTWRLEHSELPATHDRILQVPDFRALLEHF